MISQAKKIECDYIQVLFFHLENSLVIAGLNLRRSTIPSKQERKGRWAVVKQAELKYSES